MIQIWNNCIAENEINNLLNAIANRQITEGSILENFQSRIAEMVGVKYAVGTSSGTAAITLSLMGAGIQPGDEVIVPDLTFIATANAAHILGAKVIVAPVDYQKLTLDFAKVDDLITDKTKAIITVDFNGRISCSKVITEKYNKMGIFLITDACQAFMSQNEEGMAGTLSNAGCLSFGITKTLTTVQGGMVLTNDAEFHDRIRIMKTQGMESIFEGNYKYAGYNFKLPDLWASIGVGQLKRINESINHMKKINSAYYDALSGKEGIDFLPRNEMEFIWMPEIVCKNRNKVRDVLQANNIMSRPLYEPLHTADYLESPASYEGIYQIKNSLLALPSGPDQPLENVEKVIEVLKSNDLI